MPYHHMTDPAWREHVVNRLDAQDKVLASQDATLRRMEGMLDTFTALRVGSGFLKWLGGLILAGIAIMGYISHK